MNAQITFGRTHRIVSFGLRVAGAACGLAASIGASSVSFAGPQQAFVAEHGRGASKGGHGLLYLVELQGRSFFVEDVVTAPATAIPLNIQFSDKNRDDYKFLMIKGLPGDFQMSAGFRTKGAWLVSLTDLENLRLMPPPQFVGGLMLQLLLVKSDGAAPEQQILSIKIQDQPAPALNAAPTNARRETGEGPTGSVQPTAPQPRRVDEAEEAAGIERARSLLDKSDISAARLVYESLALKGSAKAAFAMGQTFDPQFLNRFASQSLPPNLERARKWYRKAIELGSSDAQGRLSALDQR